MTKLDDFFEAVERQVPVAERPTAMATVDLAYTSGNPQVTFDGETVISPRTYPRLAAVAAGQRVVMLRVGRSWVVLGPLI